MSLHYDEKGKFFTDYVSKDSIQALIQTATNLIEGNLYLRSNERVSDMLNRSDRFIAVTDVVIYDLEGNELYSCEFLAVNAEQVIWLMPVEDASEENKKESS